MTASDWQDCALFERSSLPTITGNSKGPNRESKAEYQGYRGRKQGLEQYRRQLAASGNLNGRPRKVAPSNDLKSILERVGNEVVEINGRPVTLLEFNLMTMARKAARGDVPAGRHLAKLRAEAGFGKADRRYRYYKNVVAPGESRWKPLLIPAGEIERLVCRAIARSIGKPISEEIASQHMVARLWEVEAERKRLSTLFADAPVPTKREALISINARIVVGETMLSIAIDEVGAADPATRRSIDVAHDFARTGHGRAIIPAMSNPSGQADPTLVKLIAHAHAAQRMLMSGKDEPMVSGFSKRHLYRLLHLSWLAPDITAAIVEGRHPKHLNARKLLRTNGIPLEWDSQRAMLGFG